MPSATGFAAPTAAYTSHPAFNTPPTDGRHAAGRAAARRRESSRTHGREQLAGTGHDRTWLAITACARPPAAHMRARALPPG